MPFDKERHAEYRNAVIVHETNSSNAIRNSLELLEDSLDALKNGHANVTEEFLNRVIRDLKRVDSERPTAKQFGLN